MTKDEAFDFLKSVMPTYVHVGDWEKPRRLLCTGQIMRLMVRACRYECRSCEGRVREMKALESQRAGIVLKEDASGELFIEVRVRDGISPTLGYLENALGLPIRLA